MPDIPFVCRAPRDRDPGTFVGIRKRRPEGRRPLPSRGGGLDLIDAVPVAVEAPQQVRYVRAFVADEKTMIVRVFRARVRSGKGAEFESLVRTLSIPLVKRQGGLVAFYSGRPTGASADEFVMVTVWRDLASLKAFAGDDWESAVIPEDERPLLRQTFVHHYETIDSAVVPGS